MKFNFFFSFLLLPLFFYAQEHAWVYLNDKQDVTFYLDNPIEMLTQRSLDRRTNQGIALDETDVPITQSYVNQIESEPGITVKATSKWLNAVHVIGSISDIFSLNSLTFVDYIDFADNDLNSKHTPKENRYEEFYNKDSNKTQYNYGGSYNQAHQIRVDFLHDLNFTGEGMMIAIMDNGFPGVNIYNGFSYIRNNNKILGGYNFIERNSSIYDRGTHGTSVLSTIGGFVDNQIVGTAIDAEFYLFITEDYLSETPVEESYWVEAAEMADYYGVDVINTSLGYSTFDDPDYDYSYADMDGDTTFITRGADMAASKGMIVCNSAGNSGNNSWHYITAPADGDNVFTVGAVDSSGIIAGFSSYGPTSDGQIKPDVDAKGVSTTIIDANGNVTTGSGTSFSSPVMCGAVACFWQAFPYSTNFEIMQMIRESTHLYNNPNDHYGFGIPNLEFAYNDNLSISNDVINLFSIFPNPVLNNIYLKGEIHKNYNIEIYNILGKQVIKAYEPLKKSIDVSDLSPGIYTINFISEKNIYSNRFIKH